MPSYLYTPVSPYDTALPKLVITVEQGRLTELEWQNHSNKTEFITNLSLSDSHSVLIFQVIKQLDEYFLGTRKTFELPLLLDSGTEFQQQVWHELAKISYGQTTSYKELATRIGKPTAHRACANANGKNPISLIIPCHRVIAASGALGGYTGGTDIKRCLLELEKRHYKND